MNMKYKIAWKEGDTALYIDTSDRNFAAKNGSLAWRINNPGLIKHLCRFAKKNGSIGAWDKYAIFSNSLQGHQALKEWLQSKTISQSDVYAIAKHYQPTSLDRFAQNLATSVGVVATTKVKDLTNSESMWEHSFKNDSYQAIVLTKINLYRKKEEPKAELLNAQNQLAESLV